MKYLVEIRKVPLFFLLTLCVLSLPSEVEIIVNHLEYYNGNDLIASIISLE